MTMTFTEILPAIVAGGYVLMALLIWGAGKLRARVLTWAAVLVGVGTTVVWLVAALDPSGILVLGLVLLGLVVFGVLFGVAMQSESGATKFLGGGFTILLAADFWFLVVSPLLHLVGLTRMVDLRVTAGFVSSRGSSTSSSRTVRGDYLLDGAVRHADFWWVDWSKLPERGETIRVGVSPAWPTQLIESSSAAWTMIAFGAIVPLVLGAILLGTVKLSDRRRRGRDVTAQIHG